MNTLKKIVKYFLLKWSSLNVKDAHLLYFDDIRYQIDKMLLPSYIDEIESSTFKQKYMDLIDGLDEESILTVSRTITRALQVRNFKSGYMDIFSNEEKKILDYLKNEYLPSFVKLQDDLYSYKTWLFPSDHVSPCAAYYKHFIEDLKSLSDIKSKSIIDAGAFIGDSALFMSPYTNDKIFAFEPVRSNYEMLQKTIDLNKLENVVPLNLGLGSKEEVIHINNAMSASSYSDSSDLNSEPTKVTTLDEFVEKNNLHVGLIKVDVEGFEKELLKGAVNTIKTQKPAMLLSIYHSGSDFFDIKKIIEQFKLGYTFRIKQQFAGSVLPETLLIAEIPPVGQ